MQTFLTNIDFDKSAQYLDSARLNKNILETATLLDIIVNDKKNTWENHPACKQWKPYPKALSIYGMAMAKEALRRDFECKYWNIFYNEFNRMGGDREETEMPVWIVDERLYTSHRAKLKYKGRLDAVCYTIRNNLKIRSINEWLDNNNYPQKNMLQYEDILVLENIVHDNGWTLLDNWYAQFNWSEPDNNSVPYFWPSHIMEN